MKENNYIDFKLRVKELFIDYLVILAYLIVLLLVMITFYFLVLKEIPAFTQTQSQLMATFSSVIPIIAIFSILDYKKGSLGKQKVGLKLHYENKSILNSMIRNIIKFLPWQLGHIGVIRGMYTNFDWVSNFFTFLSLGLLAVMLWMGFKRKDKRHLGGFLAKTQVVLERE